MDPSEVPSEIIDRFRASSVERLENMEGAWTMLSQEPDEMILSEMQRELHTLKGDAIAIGFSDVGLICHKLEEIFLVVSQEHNHIPEDIDLVVTMAIHFLGALIRKKAGQTLGGLDLPGFIRQMDEVLREARISPQPDLSSSPKLRSVTTPNGSATKDKLAVVATDIFLEHLQVTGSSKDRLYNAFTTLAEHISESSAVPLEPKLARHTSSARELAGILQKELQIFIEIDEEIRVQPKVAEALDIATLHLIRNALDHAIEKPAVRDQLGKKTAGAIKISAKNTGKSIELRVEDDGQGINFEKVKARAIEFGLLNPEQTPSEKELLELLFQPGFSTSAQVSEISGRGVGLDAAKVAIEQRGGTLRFETQAGLSTTAIVTVPQEGTLIQVYSFPSTREGLLLAVPASWPPCALANTESPLDVLARLGVLSPNIAGATTLSFKKGDDTISLLGKGSSSLNTAVRLCPTSDLHPVEVISLRGPLALLLHPEALLKTKIS
jgi:two-component system chemotaxis sensor kinase CheA